MLIQFVERTDCTIAHNSSQITEDKINLLEMIISGGPVPDAGFAGFAGFAGHWTEAMHEFGILV